MSGWIVHPLADRDERDELADVIATAFGFPRESSDDYFDSVSSIHVIRASDAAGGRLAGGLAVIDMGQFFGGRSVRTAGVASVGIASEYRGDGAATELMSGVMHRLRDEGYALSSLFPAVMPLYRRAGYEVAGLACSTVIPLRHHLPVERSLSIRAARPDDEPLMASLYEEHARPQNGMLDRTPFFWARARRWRFEPADGYVVERDGNVEGYVYAVRIDGPTGSRMAIPDLVARTPAATTRILSFLRDHHSIIPDAICRQHASQPMFAALTHQHWECSLDEHWMLRIVDVERALRERGYRAGVFGELHLAVHDPVIAANCVSVTLRVDDGVPSVTAGGRGDLEIDARGLASLYAGLHRVDTLVRIGRATVHDDRAHIADTLFGDGTAWMPDRF